jgi:glycosyltransferase involved in cell wall biosynthesis
MIRHKLSRPLPPLYVLDPGNFTPRYDVNLASALAQRGWQPCWATSPHCSDDIALPGEIRAIEAFFGFMRSPRLKLLKCHPRLRQAAKCASYPFYMKSFSDTLLASEPGIIHVQWALLPVLDLLFWRRWRAHGWTIVFTVHDPKPLAGTLPQILTWGQSHLWTEADAVIVHSMEGAGTIRRAGVREDSLHIIPPGPPTASSAVSRNEARAALDIPRDLPVVLFFGYIKRYKGLDVLLRSLPPLKKMFGEFLCVVAGEFKEPSKPYRLLTSQLQLQHEVRWLEGYIPERSMALFFSACDVVALPYLDASSSGVLLCAYA